jgi:hypothetical protein
MQLLLLKCAAERAHGLILATQRIKRQAIIVQADSVLRIKPVRPADEVDGFGVIAVKNPAINQLEAGALAVDHTPNMSGSFESL